MSGDSDAQYINALVKIRDAKNDTALKKAVKLLQKLAKKKQNKVKPFHP